MHTSPSNPGNVYPDISAFNTPRFTAFEINESNVDLLQRFFDQNPEYFFTTGGAAPRENEAVEELRDVPPSDFPCSRILILCWADAAGKTVAQATLVFDLFAERVLHIGLFIVATARHGGGTAQECHAAIERVARENGYRWLRLGVVRGNARAERFWERCGYGEVRVREGVEIGKLTHTIRVMLRSLSDQGLTQYLTQVPRDQPGQT